MPEEQQPSASPEETGEQQQQQQPTRSLDDLPDELSWVRDEVKRARGEAANYRTKLREVEPLAQKARELEESQKTEQERLTEQLEAARRDGSAAASEAARLRVAIAKGLPASLVDRLRGDTQEDLEADADALLELVGRRDEPIPRGPRERLRAGATSTSDEEADDMNLQIRRALGRT